MSVAFRGWSQGARKDVPRATAASRASVAVAYPERLLWRRQGRAELAESAIRETWKSNVARGAPDVPSPGDPSNGHVDRASKRPDKEGCVGAQNVHAGTG